MAQTIDLSTLSAVETGALIRAGSISTEETLEFCRQRTKQMDMTLNAFISQEEAVTENTRLVADRILAQTPHPGDLTGVPMGLKDNICTTELPTTCGSRMLAGYRPPMTPPSGTGFVRVALF